MKLFCCNPKLALFSKDTFTGTPELMIDWLMIVTCPDA